VPGNLRGRLERLRVAHLKGRREIHLGGLCLHCRHNLVAAVAGVDAPQAGRAVENASSVVRQVIHPFCACQQARRALELTVRGKGHPERSHIRWIGLRSALVHLVSPRKVDLPV
jgi:hypothetical protein